MKMTKTTRFFFLYTLYFVLALGVYVFFYLHINNKSDNVGETLSEIARLQEQHSQMENLQQTIRDTEEGRDKLATFFVDSDRIIEFLETIENMADSAQAEIDVTSLNEFETEDEKVKDLALSINFEGEWSHVHHFLYLLENLPVKLTVDRLSFRESGERTEEDAPIWKGNVSLKVLQLKK